jgi:rhomboid protease GluP
LARMSVSINRGFFESPHPATYFFLAANIVIFGLCANQAGTQQIPGALLFRNGAMYAQAIERQEYWRLVASGFLHANLVHVASNMLCLGLWGGHLEKRVGTAYFVLIYLAALVAGSIVSNLTHTSPYLGVGASGAISGILGALLCLRVLAKLDLPLNFFVINIGLNVAIAFTASRIDWAAHAGGFVVGFAALAGLDLVEKANAYLLRCKFPEFAKLNLLLLAFGFLFLAWLTRVEWLLWAAPVLCIGAVKVVDIALSRTKGLAAVVIGLSIANAALLLALTAALAPRGCGMSYAPAFPRMRDLLVAICTNVTAASIVMAVGALALTLLLYSLELQRGLKDIGFVSASMTGERKRRYGL